MSRTIEAIMRHMTPPSNRTTDPRNGVEKLEKEITVKKRHYIWSESRFVRTILPFHSNIRVGYNDKEADGKSVLDLMTLLSLVQPPSIEKAQALGVRAAFVAGHPSGAQLAEIADIINSGKLAPVINRILPLSEVRRAHEISQSGHTHGKIVLRVKNGDGTSYTQSIGRV